uniref:Uncharacterized protein n=1 Tax=Knipowitschia caucasica TaxID=637954 RepID=A0AAV2MQB8_KNICA
MFFGVAELLSFPVFGWYKLLSQVEVQFFHAPLSEQNDGNEELWNGLEKAELVPRDKSLSESSTSMNQVELSHFNFRAVLGIGRYVKVLMAEMKTSKELHAMKMLRKDMVIQGDYIKCALVEKRVLALVSLPSSPTRRIALVEMLVGDPLVLGEEDLLYKAIFYSLSLSKEAVSVCKRLLTKEPLERLGCGLGGERNIRGHFFFRCIDWERLQSREIQHLFKPLMCSKGAKNVIHTQHRDQERVASCMFTCQTQVINDQGQLSSKSSHLPPLSTTSSHSPPPSSTSSHWPPPSLPLSLSSADVVLMQSGTRQALTGRLWSPN